MEDAISTREEGSPRVAQHRNLRPLLIRLEGLERHRVHRWLNCCTRPPDFRFPNTAKSPSSPDNSFNRFLWFFFFLILSLGLMKILYEESLIDNGPSPHSFIPNYRLSSYFYAPVVLLVMLVAVAACVAKKKMKNTDFTLPRKEEVKTISGLIQQV